MARVTPWRKFAVRRLAPFILFLLLAFVWEWVAASWRSVLPPLGTVGADIVSRPLFYAGHLAVTLRTALAGFAIGGMLACAIAGLCVRYPILEAAVMPLVVTLSVTPVVAIAPALIVAFGFTDAPHIIIAALSAFFPMFVSALSGLRRTDQAAVEVFRSLAAGPWDTFFQLQLPASLPSIFAGARLAITAAIIGAIVSEFTGTSRGLGATIVLATTYLNLAQMWGAIFTSVVTTLCLIGLVNAVERALIRW